MVMKKNMKIKRDPQEAAEPTKAERKKAAKEKLGRGAKIALVAVGCAAMLLSVSAMACSGILNEAKNKDEYTLTGGVAATVNGTNITEDTVTRQVMSYRTSAGYTDDKDWAQFLVDQGQTPESYRENIIEGIAREFLVTSAINEYGIEVSDEDLDEAFDNAAAGYGGKEALLGFLEQIGYTEETYKQTLASSIANEKLREKVADVDDPTDGQIVEYFNGKLDTYNDARRSSNLLIKVDSEATDDEKQAAKDKAQEVLDKINAGELTFEDAVEEYSDDTGSKEDAGDVGWDKLTSFVTEYQDALSQLGKGQMSGLVETTYGYHIILCTDVLKLDGPATSIDQLPEEYRDYISNVISTQEEQTAYNKWLTEYTEKADIKINAMPKDVPYNVSLEGVEPSSADDPADTE